MSNISVVMPVKNGAKFLESAIKFIATNIEENDEVVVIDDHSTDETLSILKNWSSSDIRVKVLKGEKSGISSSLNYGIRSASHDWIARFDVDDLYSADRLSKQRTKIEPGIVAIFCDYKFVDEKGAQNFGSMPTAVTDLATSVSLASGIRTPHPGVLFNKEAAKEAGQYDDNYLHCEDLSLWLRMSRLGKLITVPEYLLEYRLHPGSVSVQNRAITKKTRQRLMNDVGVNVNDFKLLLSNLETTTEIYKKLPDFDLRTLLLLREIIRTACSHPKYFGAVATKLIDLLCSGPDLNIFQSFGRLKNERDLRNLYRDGKLQSM